MDLFVGGLILLIVGCSLLSYYNRKTTPVVQDNNVLKFQSLYLTVYLLAMMADWLQGPHVYALYESYNMTKHQIEMLFITGFASSMIFGTIVGSFADKYGRRFNCILYGILYGIGCLTKHFNNFHVLMFGRLLAGISTSILYSAFESWLVYEHKTRGFAEETLNNIFANAYFGNSFVAIASGVIAQFVADSFGFVAPFDTSFLTLICMIAYISMYWSENYGDSNADLKQSFITAWEAIKTDQKVFCLGLIQSLFEGSMYIFVLEWTPALNDTASELIIPHGFIFAAFMVAVMIGSNIFKILIKLSSTIEFMKYVLLTSALALAVPILFPTSQMFKFMAFVIFEICVGIFWPAMGTLRGKLVPEAARSTIMNFFRIPLNLIVVVILYHDLEISKIFQSCVIFLILSVVGMFRLNKLCLSEIPKLVIQKSEYTEEQKQEEDMELISD